MPHSILDKLTGGDLRSIGQANDVAAEVLHDPSLFGAVFEGLFQDDGRVRMRAADVLQKVSEKRPELLQPFKTRLIQEVSAIPQQEVQWHTAQMLSYLVLDEAEQAQVADILFGYLDTTRSNIVKVNSMQTLAELAERNPLLKPRVIEKIAAMTETGSPAVINRGRKLLQRLKA
jgi:hypothetical protein